MTSVDPNLDDLQDDPQGLRSYAERQAQAAKDAQKELADLRKKDGFRDAGLDPANPLHAAVIDGYTGEKDGIKDFVSTLGLTSSTAPEPPPIPAQERDALNQVANLHVGDGGGSPDPEADGNARLQDITTRATREKWPQSRFNEEFTAEMVRQRRPVANMDVVN